MDPKFDVRTLEHKIRAGVLTREEIDAYLASLPDEAEEAVPTETRFVASFAERHRDTDEG